MTHPDQPRIIPIREVMRLTSLSRSTLWRLQQKGAFPGRITLSTNRVGFREQEVITWLNQRGEG